MKRLILAGSLLMNMLYGQLYADEGHTSFINVRTAAVGKVAWSKSLVSPDGKDAEIRLLLTDANIVIVEGMKKLFAFSQDGRELWQREKWSGTPVALKEGRIYFTSPERKNEMRAIDMSNAIQLQDYRMPNVGDQSYLVLFEPFRDGLIAQVQYPDIAEKGGMALIVYKIHKGGLSYDWSKRYDREESPILPLLCDGGKVVLTSTNKEAIAFDANSKDRDPVPYSRFPLPFGKSTTGVSCGQDRNLYWCGVKGRNTMLTVTDLSGKETWRWSSDSRPPGAVIPPIVTPDRVYLLNQKRLSALQNGKHLWSYEATTGNFSFSTALADGSILLVEGNKLHRISSEGKSLFVVTLNETIATPPVVDGAGNIYVASKQTLYAIH
jgi:outer membrane protein assembly factor BamB